VHSPHLPIIMMKCSIRTQGPVSVAIRPSPCEQQREQIRKGRVRCSHPRPTHFSWAFLTSSRTALSKTCGETQKQLLIPLREGPAARNHCRHIQYQELAKAPRPFQTWRSVSSFLIPVDPSARDQNVIKIHERKSDISRVNPVHLPALLQREFGLTEAVLCR
jgi:hypothetical protein